MLILVLTLLHLSCYLITIIIYKCIVNVLIILIIIYLTDCFGVTCRLLCVHGCLLVKLYFKWLPFICRHQLLPKSTVWKCYTKDLMMMRLHLVSRYKSLVLFNIFSKLFSSCCSLLIELWSKCTTYDVYF